MPNKISTAQTPPSSSDLNILYKKALLDAADPQDNEVLNNLTIIDKSNQSLQWEGEPGKSRILVATFTTEKGYKIGNFTPPPEGIWVTVVPELKNFCKQYLNTGVNQKQLNLRLKQLLGLPPDSEYNTIAEIWVAIQYLKRPSLDPEINDATVQTFPNPIKYPLRFSQGADSAYQAWFTNLIMNRKSSHYPFTGLGYTYDWEPKTNLQNDAGLSEFIIFPNSQVSTLSEVKQVLPTEEYCKEENSAMKIVSQNIPLFVHYKSWTDEITIENKHFKHIYTEYEYDNPVSGNPSRSKQSVLTDTDLNEEQWKDLETKIKSSGFDQLKDSYGAPEGYRFYPYNLTIDWGTEKKEVKYRSNPSYEEAPEPFKIIERYLLNLSEQIR